MFQWIDLYQIVHMEQYMMLCVACAKYVAI